MPALPSEAIWLPRTHSDRAEWLAAKAVEEYDADLMLGQNRQTGDWCAFLPGNQNSEGQPFPVFSFGPDLPSPERAKELLYKNDVRRNGRELMDELDRIYEREQKAIADRAEEGREAVAEAIISNLRMNGQHPYPSIHMGTKYGKTKTGKQRIRSSG